MRSVHWILALISIALAGVILRFYQLGTVPHGLAWDEAAIGYNGFAIRTTRRDEWLERLPVSFRSFGDYKAPLAIYINGLSTAVFGLHPLGVRLPFAVGGSIAICMFALVAHELARGEQQRRIFALIAAGLLATSPWHIHYSRAAFESGLALLLVLVMVFAFLRFCADQRIVRQLQWISLAVTAASLSMYAYHSAKITVPLLCIGLAIVYRSALYKRALSLIPGMGIAVILVIPLLRDSLWGQGLTRASVSIFTKEPSLGIAVGTTISQFLQHLHPAFLVLGQTTTLRHGTGDWGVLLPTTYLLILVGLGLTAVARFGGIESAKRTRLGSNRRVAIALLWIATGLLPAAIGTEVPHSNRALLALPGFLLLAVEGAALLWTWCSQQRLNSSLRGSHGETHLLPKTVLGVVLLIHVLLSTAFVHFYFTKFSANSAAAFSDGYIEAFELAEQYEKGTNGKAAVDTIIFSDAYGQPYIYALFVRKTNPIWYQGGSLVKYQFATVRQSDLSRENALVVSVPSEGLPEQSADHVVYGSDGSVRFLLYKTPK